MSVPAEVTQGAEEAHEVVLSIGGAEETRIAIQPELAAALATLAEATRCASPSIPLLPAQQQLAQLEEDYQRGLSPIHEVSEHWGL